MDKRIESVTWREFILFWIVTALMLIGCTLWIDRRAMTKCPKCDCSMVMVETGTIDGRYENIHAKYILWTGDDPRRK